MTSAGAPADVVGAYLAEVLDDPRWTACTTSLIAGGASNLTYLVASPAGELVLRRPPLGSVLPTAHDMAREVRVLRALAGTAVPVPEVLATEPDASRLGQPFYVMRKVDGHVAREALPPGYADEPAQQAAVGAGVVDVLLDLHALDWRTRALEGHGRPEGFLPRQLRRWSAQWDAAKAVEVPALDALADALSRSVPAESAAAVVHGDYRLDNVLLHPDQPGRVTAVLDWELSTLGDPLVDLGLLLVYWSQPADTRIVAGLPAVTRQPGFPSRADVVEQYAAGSGRSLESLDWYVAFGAFKLAVVLAGVAMRARHGAMAGGAFEGVEERVPELVELGRDALAGRALEPR
jgi:aminoglycoside phosphotransferase (APT) family kinase protein